MPDVMDETTDHKEGLVFLSFRGSVEKTSETLQIRRLMEDSACGQLSH